MAEKQQSKKFDAYGVLTGEKKRKDVAKLQRLVVSNIFDEDTIELALVCVKICLRLTTLDTFGILVMIIGFKNKDTENFYNGVFVRKFSSFDRQAERRLRILNDAETLQDLQALPSNQLEKLKGDRQEQYSIRINQQWRICFVWEDNGPNDVEIVDYH